MTKQPTKCLRSALTDRLAMVSRNDRSPKTSCRASGMSTYQGTQHDCQSCPLTQYVSNEHSANNVTPIKKPAIIKFLAPYVQTKHPRITVCAMCQTPPLTKQHVPTFPNHKSPDKTDQIHREQDVNTHQTT